MEDQEISLSQLSSKIRYPVKSLTILVVDDDTTCLSVVAAFLKSLKYQVVTVKHPDEALSTLKKKENSFDLVITDVHMPDMNGFELQKKIDQEFKLPVVFMSADDQDGVMVKGLQSGASFFIVKPVSPNDLKDLWQYAFANKRGKAVLEEIETAQQTAKPEKPCNGNTLISDDKPSEGKERKRKLPKNEVINDDLTNAITKKTKFVWTTSLHNQFLEAIRSIGLDKAVPKKILELMDVNGLTREHVASHLQKYRLFVKKVTETSSRIQFDQLQSSATLELPSAFLSSKQPVGGYFPISKPLKFLSSSFNHRYPFSSNSNPGSGNALLSLLYNKNNSRQPVIQTQKSIYDTESFVYTNKPNVPFSGNYSQGVVIAQKKPQLASEKGTRSGISIDMLSSGKVGSFDHQKFYLEPNFKGMAKPGTSESKGLEETSDFYFENELNNRMGNETMINTVQVLSGTCGDIVPTFGVSSSNNQNQLTYHHLNSDYYGGEHVEMLGSLDDISGSRNSLFMQQFDDHSDASSIWLNQANIHSQTQQQSVDKEIMPNFGIDESPSLDQNFQLFDPNSFQFDEEFLQSMLNPGKEGGDCHPGTI